MAIKVAKVNKQETTRYIGRDWAGHKQSPYHNPFHVGKDGDREEVLLKFIIYWYGPNRQYLRDLALNEIGPDETLGCWCHGPEKDWGCHGDVIAGYLAWRRHQGGNACLF